MTKTGKLVAAMSESRTKLTNVEAGIPQLAFAKVRHEHIELYKAHYVAAVTLQHQEVRLTGVMATHEHRGHERRGILSNSRSPVWI